MYSRRNFLRDGILLSSLPLTYWSCNRSIPSDTESFPKFIATWNNKQACDAKREFDMYINFISDDTGEDETKLYKFIDQEKFKSVLIDLKNLFWCTIIRGSHDFVYLSI